MEPNHRIFAGTLVVLERSDITQIPADAIVNAANAALAGGGGVDGAIHRAGGPSIMEACRALPYLSPGVKCPTGEVRTTGAGDLNARWVIHAVGPVYDSREPNEAERLLASAYRSALMEAQHLGARAVVFPSLSTGAFRFPLRTAAGIALSTVAEVLQTSPGVFERVTFALFSEHDLAVFTRALHR